MSRIKLRRWGRSALLLMVVLEVGCAPNHPVASSTLAAAQAAMQPPVRAIIYFQQPTSDSRQLSAAIADACHCQPVFFRPYSADALIYEIALPHGQSFAAFEKALMLQAAQLRIKLVEQDIVMQHQ